MNLRFSKSHWLINWTGELLNDFSISRSKSKISGIIIIHEGEDKHGADAKKGRSWYAWGIVASVGRCLIMHTRTRSHARIYMCACIQRAIEYAYTHKLRAMFLHMCTRVRTRVSGITHGSHVLHLLTVIVYVRRFSTRAAGWWTTPTRSQTRARDFGMAKINFIEGILFFSILLIAIGRSSPYSYYFKSNIEKETMLY